MNSENRSQSKLASQLQHAKFAVAAHKASQWMPDSGCEIAFAGRSNSGKSSAINAIVGQRALAVASKTPGRTRQIVFFEIDASARLVDLPGYGYAKVPADVRSHWARQIEQYFTTRKSLSGLILTMDIRHPLKALDQRLIDFSLDAGVGVHILLTKSDKLSKSKGMAAVRSVAHSLQHAPTVSVQAFSILTRNGVVQARQQVCAALASAADA